MSSMWAPHRCRSFAGGAGYGRRCPLSEMPRTPAFFQTGWQTGCDCFPFGLLGNFGFVSCANDSRIRIGDYLDLNTLFSSLKRRLRAHQAPDPSEKEAQTKNLFRVAPRPGCTCRIVRQAAPVKRSGRMPITGGWRIVRYWDHLGVATLAGKERMPGPNFQLSS